MVACGAPGPEAPTSAAPDVAFGDVELGSSASRAVRLTNSSKARVTLSDVIVGGEDVVASGAALPNALDPAESTTVTVKFAPQVSGTYSGALRVSSTSGTDAFALSWKASVVRRRTPLAFGSDVQFGNVAVGSSVSRAVTVTNRSSAAVTVSAVASSSSAVRVSGLSLPATIAAGASTSFALVYQPTAAGAAAGYLALRSSSGANLGAVEWGGTGTAPSVALSASPSRVDFGGVTVGDFSAQSVTITNISQDPISISSLVTSGAGFAASGLALPTAVPAGGSTTFSVRFMPGAPGAASGSVVLRAEGASAPAATVALAGSGVAAAGITSVAVPGVSVEAGGSVQLVANVVATGTIDTSVSWSIESGSLGTIDPVSGLYATPATPGTYRVVATSNADATKKGVGVVTVTAPPEPVVVAVAVSPTNAALMTGGTQSFAATVTGAADPSVAWSVQEGVAGGTITSAGVYTAPAAAGVYHVVATSNADPTKRATAIVTVVAPAPVAIAVSPTTASLTAGGTRSFSATVTNATNTSVTWAVQEGATGGTITSAGVYTAPATAGTYHVVARSVADTTKSATATVTVTAAPTVAVAVSPTTASLSTSGARTFSATVTGSTNTSVTWSVQEGATGGSITSAGVYTAPATAGTYHVVARSAADTTKTATSTVTVTAPAPTPTGAVDPKSYGAVGDGVADDTAAFQAAANTKKPLLVTAPRVRYRLTTGIKIYNSVQGDGSMPQIWLDTPTGDWPDSMLQVLDYTGTGLTISGVRLNGGWTGSGSGEHSSGVHIAGSQNVTVQDTVLENFLGDGVYVGGGGLSAKPSRNIVVQNNRIDNPRRCNVAVIYVDGLQVRNNVLNKSNTYVADIDIEPNPNGTDSAWNVVIDSNTFTSPIENPVSLYHSSTWPTPTGGVGGNITISNNTGDVNGSVNITSSADWANVKQSNNTFR